LGHLTHKIVSEMTYNVWSGTLNSAISYHTLGLPCDSQYSLLGELLLRARVMNDCRWKKFNSGRMSC